MLSSWSSQADSATSSGGTYYNQSGFIHVFLMNPSLDTDSDGIPDENDADNDNDGLTDIDELTGAYFEDGTVTSTILADTDNDGMSDREESIHGTNPLDANSICEVSPLLVPEDPSHFDIVVGTVSGREYRIQYSDHLLNGPLWSFFKNTNEGFGTYTHSFPTNSFFTFRDDYSSDTTDVIPADGRRYYRVRVTKP